VVVLFASWILATSVASASASSLPGSPVPTTSAPTSHVRSASPARPASHARSRPHGGSASHARADRRAASARARGSTRLSAPGTARPVPPTPGSRRHPRHATPRPTTRHPGRSGKGSAAAAVAAHEGYEPPRLSSGRALVTGRRCGRGIPWLSGGRGPPAPHTARTAAAFARPRESRGASRPAPGIPPDSPSFACAGISRDPFPTVCRDPRTFRRPLVRRFEGAAACSFMPSYGGVPCSVPSRWSSCSRSRA
jgi:hypothetical protein